MSAPVPTMPCGIEHPDADIIFAWEHRRAAFDAYNLLPHSDVAGEVYTKEEREQLDIIEECEQVINSTDATTPIAVELKLWVALCRDISDREEEVAANRSDFDWFSARESDLDWPRRLMFSAIRSLRTMAEDQHRFADAWLKLWTDKGGSIFLEPTGKAQIGFPTYDLSHSYEKAAHRREGPCADRNGWWDDGHYYGTMNALHAALTAHPSGADMLKAHLRDRGISSCMPAQGEAK